MTGSPGSGYSPATPKTPPIVVAYDITILARECEHLPDNGTLKEYIRRIAMALDTKIVDTVTHDFDPWGVTHCAVLSTSHAIVHTYPEHRLAYVNISSCKEPASMHRLLDLTCQCFHVAIADIECDVRRVTL